MGNHAKRAKAARALKAQGLGKLYRGNSHLAREHMDAWWLKTLLWRLQFKTGDLVNNCDAVNHVIKKWLTHRCSFARWHNIPGERGLKERSGWFFDMDQAEFEDGTWSCGCPSSPDPPLTQAQIEAYFTEAYTEERVAESKRGGWWGPASDRRKAAFDSGKHVVDERGMIYPEFLRQEGEE